MVIITMTSMSFGMEYTTLVSQLQYLRQLYNITLDSDEKKIITESYADARLCLGGLISLAEITISAPNLELQCAITSLKEIQQHFFNERTMLNMILERPDKFYPTIQSLAQATKELIVHIDQTVLLSREKKEFAQQLIGTIVLAKRRMKQFERSPDSSASDDGDLPLLEDISPFNSHNVSITELATQLSVGNPYHTSD